MQVCENKTFDNVISPGKSSSTKISNKQKIALTIVAIIDFLSFCSIDLLALFQPIQRGETLQVFGQTIKFSSLVTVISTPFVSQNLIKMGIRNVFLVAVIISRMCTAFFGALHLVKDEETLTYLSYLLRGIESLGITAYFIAGYTIVFSSFPDHVGFVRGCLEAIVGIGITVGPAVGELLSTMGGFGVPFYCVGGFVLILPLIGACFLEEVSEEEKDLGSFRYFISIPSVIITSFVVLAVSITANYLDSTFRDHLNNSPTATMKKVSYVYLFIAIIFGLTSPIWTYISEKYQKRCGFLMSTGLYLSGLSLMFLDSSLFYKQDTIYLKLVVLSVLGLAMSMSLVPSFRSFIVAAMANGFKSSPTTHCYVSSIWLFAFSIGEILAPVLGSIFFPKYNFAISCFLIAIINLCVAVTTTIFFYSKRKSRNVCCVFSITIYFQ